MSKGEQGEPQSLIERAREWRDNFGEYSLMSGKRWTDHLVTMFAKQIADELSAASLPESQPAPEMDYSEDECPAWGAWEAALNDMRVRFPEGNELELLASEYLRLRRAELAHDARAQSTLKESSR